MKRQDLTIGEQYWVTRSYGDPCRAKYLGEGQPVWSSRSRTNHRPLRFELVETPPDTVKFLASQRALPADDDRRFTDVELAEHEAKWKPGTVFTVRQGGDVEHTWAEQEVIEATRSRREARGLQLQRWNTERLAAVVKRLGAYDALEHVQLDWHDFSARKGQDPAVKIDFDQLIALVGKLTGSPVPVPPKPELPSA